MFQVFFLVLVFVHILSIRYRQGSTWKPSHKLLNQTFIIYFERPLCIGKKITWDLLSKYPGGPNKGRKNVQQVGAHWNENENVSYSNINTLPNFHTNVYKWKYKYKYGN